MGRVILGGVYYDAEPPGIPRDRPYGLRGVAQKTPPAAIHVIQRGNNRGSRFRAASDQALYLSFLRECSTKFGCRVHAYCLMPNHVRLLMTPASPEGCAAMMRDLGQRYVPWATIRMQGSALMPGCSRRRSSRRSPGVRAFALTPVAVTC